MKELVQRRERLKAMCIEADESTGTSHNLNYTSSSTLHVHLSSPLLDPIVAAVQERSAAAQRFHFYTDPMAAFSGNKRRNIKIHQQTPPNYFSPTPVIRPPSSLQENQSWLFGFPTTLMEESVQRRERLKAMRIEADESTRTSHNLNYTYSSSTLHDHLSSPLLDPTVAATVQERSPEARRFDFYTDPMAAFSGNKRRNIETHQQTPPNYFSPPPVIQLPSSLQGPRNLEMTPTPSLQFQSSYSPVQRPPPYHGSGYYRSPNPVGFATPFPGHQGTPPEVWNRPGGTGGYGFPPNPPSVGSFPKPGFVQGDTRPNLGRGTSQQFHSNPNPSWERGSPRPDFGRDIGHQFHNYPNPSWERGSPRPDFERGIGQQFHNYPNPSPGRGSPRPDLGRGGGQRFNNNPRPGSGRGGGRERGLHACVSAQESPGSFYSKSMVEDPWRSLKPIVRSIDSAKSWLPKSISTKRAKISESVRNSSSEPSLAEYLAATMEAVTEDETGVL